MKKVWKYIIGAIGIVIWFFVLILFRAMDTEYQSNTHQIIIIVTGICLAIYIWKKSGSGVKELEKENRELKKENQELRQQLQDQTVRRAMEKAESREKES